MTGHAFAKSFRDLVVYQKARAVARDLFQRTQAFPREELYSLTDQMRRSSRSIGAQIAEAWAKRRYPPHFTAKLSDADGEQNETQHWVDTALDCGYLSQEEAAALTLRLQEVGRMLQRMMEQAASFRGEDYGHVRDESPGYSVTTDGSVSPGCVTRASAESNPPAAPLAPPRTEH